MATVSSSLNSDNNLFKHEGMDSLSRYQLCRLLDSEANAWTVRGRATTIDIRNPFKERGGTPRQRQLPDFHLPLGEMTSIKWREQRLAVDEKGRTVENQFRIEGQTEVHSHCHADEELQQVGR
jgi:hypothetical protein